MPRKNPKGTAKGGGKKKFDRSSFLSACAKNAEAFAKASTRGGGDPPPPGDYLCLLKGASLGTKKPSDGPSYNWMSLLLQVAEGDFKDYEFDGGFYSDREAAAWMLKKVLAVLFDDAPPKNHGKAMLEVCEKLVKSGEVYVGVTVKESGAYTNVYINELVGDMEEEDDEDVEEDDAPKKKKSKKSKKKDDAPKKKKSKKSKKKDDEDLDDDELDFDDDDDEDDDDEDDEDDDDEDDDEDD